MKKELKKTGAKLSLGKMTVAKLEMSQRHLRFIIGGGDTNDTKTATQPTVDLTHSLVDDNNNPCGTPKPSRTATL